MSTPEETEIAEPTASFEELRDRIIYQVEVSKMKRMNDDGECCRVAFGLLVRLRIGFWGCQRFQVSKYIPQKRFSRPNCRESRKRFGFEIPHSKVRQCAEFGLVIQTWNSTLDENVLNAQRDFLGTGSGNT